MLTTRISDTACRNLDSREPSDKKTGHVRRANSTSYYYFIELKIEVPVAT